MTAIQSASDWPDNRPVSKGLDFMVFGELKALIAAARAYRERMG